MKAGTELHLVIRLNSTDEFVGAAGLHPADGTMLETGIWIKESAQGHGYGREAVAAVIKWASEKFRPSGSLYPVVDANTPSRKLAEALGGKIIGTRHDTNPATRSGNCCSTAYPCPSSWRGAPCYGQSPCFCPAEAPLRCGCG
jgi:RimJ/RimL family protein N-acetyltransferase